MSEQNGQYVRFTVFKWAIGIITTILIALFGLLISFMGEVSDIKSDISSIKTDINWIKITLSDNNKVSKFLEIGGISKE